ncbi:MAG: DUF86 domain-containing protein [Spirochaetaceae bacterium]|nr:DUF86 domain-containing protein [Spirochaetaceae bacterium]
MHDVVRRKLESLRRCMGRIEEKRPKTVEILKTDYDIQDIISLNLERAIQLSVDIGSYLLAESEQTPPNTMGEIFSELAVAGIITEDLAHKLRKAVGFRNISVHEYQNVDWEIVFSIINRNLDDFKDFMRAVI